MDSRLDVYRTNCRRVPSVAGRVIPEPVFDRIIPAADPRADVRRNRPARPRGRPARTSGSTPAARSPDSTAGRSKSASSTCKNVPQRTWRSARSSPRRSKQSWPSAGRTRRGKRKWRPRLLEAILLATIRDADQAIIDDREYLAHFGVDRQAPMAPAICGDTSSKRRMPQRPKFPPESRDASHDPKPRPTRTPNPQRPKHRPLATRRRLPPTLQLPSDRPQLHSAAVPAEIRSAEAGNHESINAETPTFSCIPVFLINLRVSVPPWCILRGWKKVVTSVIPSSKYRSAEICPASYQTIRGRPNASHSDSVQARGITSSRVALSIKILRPRTLAEYVTGSMTFKSLNRSSFVFPCFVQ